MAQNQLVDAIGILIRHQPDGDFGPRPGWDDGFAALALIAAGQPIDLERWPPRALFQWSEAPLAKQLADAQKLRVLAWVERQPRRLFSLESRKRLNVVVKTRNR